MDTKIEIHRRGLDVRTRNMGKWRIPDEVKSDILRFLDDLELGKVNKGRRISKARRLKYLDMLRPVLEFWDKPIENLVLADVEAFEKALHAGSIKSRYGRPYFESTKSDIHKALRIFLRWRLGRERSIVLTDWLDTRDVKKTPDYIRETDVERLLKKCRTVEQRFVIAVLFDSGARAEEFHNIRFEDIQLPEGRDNYVRLTLKEEYSKTKGRVIALFWKHSVEAVRDYLGERIRQGIKPKDPVYRNGYDASRRWLFRLGREVLGRSVHYHLFRHSSATFYANKLNRQELCYRYGWAFSSDMPDVYISRAGMANKDLDLKFASTEMNQMRDRVEQIERKNHIAQESLASMKRQNEALVGELKEYLEFLRAARAKVCA